MPKHHRAILIVNCQSSSYTLQSNKGNDGSSIFTRYAMRSWQVDQVIFEDGVVPSLSDFARQVCMTVNAPKPVADALKAKNVSPGAWDWVNDRLYTADGRQVAYTDMPGNAKGVYYYLNRHIHVMRMEAMRRGYQGWFLRVLAQHVPLPPRQDNATGDPLVFYRTFNGTTHASFQEAAVARGLLPQGGVPRLALEEGIKDSISPEALVSLFVIMTIEGLPTANVLDRDCADMQQMDCKSFDS